MNQHANKLRNVQALVETAIRKTLIAWSEDDCGVDPRVLLDALTNLQCARDELSGMIEAEDPARSEITLMAAALSGGQS